MYNTFKGKFCFIFLLVSQSEAQEISFEQLDWIRLVYMSLEFMQFQSQVKVRLHLLVQAFSKTL